MIAFVPVVLVIAFAIHGIVVGSRARTHKHFKHGDFYSTCPIADPMAEVEEACDKLGIPAPRRPYDR